MFKKTVYAVILLVVSGSGYAMEGQDIDPDIFPTVPISEEKDKNFDPSILNTPERKTILKTIPPKKRKRLQLKGRRARVLINLIAEEALLSNN